MTIVNRGVGVGVIRPNPASNTGGGAWRWADRPAPPGYQWDFVFDSGVMVRDNGEPVVDLVRN